MNHHLELLAPILSNAFKVPVEQIRPESRLKEDLKADSLDAAIALMDVEEKFKIIVPERARVYVTVADILAHIDELVLAKANGAETAKVVPVVETLETISAT